MNEVKNIDAQVRQEYEPVSVRVVKVTPQGVLCQSGGVEREVTGGLTEYTRF